jgi:hypothetical protein
MQWRLSDVSGRRDGARRPVEMSLARCAFVLILRDKRPGGELSEGDGRA